MCGCAGSPLFSNWEGQGVSTVVERTHGNQALGKLFQNTSGGKGNTNTCSELAVHHHPRDRGWPCTVELGGTCSIGCALGVAHFTDPAVCRNCPWFFIIPSSTNSVPSCLRFSLVSHPGAFMLADFDDCVPYRAAVGLCSRANSWSKRRKRGKGRNRAEARFEKGFKN